MSLPNHHRPDGGFRNPWPGGQPGGFRDFLKWTLVERRRNPRRPDPDRRTFVRVTPAFTVPRTPPEPLTITWVGHSSWLIQIAGLNVLTDPIWSRRASPVQFVGPRRWVPPAIEFDRLPPIDVVLISHDHYDHLDANTISRIAERYPAVVWLAPLGLGAFLKRRGARDITERDWWQESSVGALRLTCVPARHFSGRTLGRRNRTLWCGWTLQSAQHSVFFAGDTALHPEFSTIGERCGPFELAILPIGAYEPRWFMGAVHMNPEDCIKAVAQLTSAQKDRRLTMIAGHWGTFKLTDEPMDEPPSWMRELWQTADHDANDLWILQHGETRSI